MEPDNEHKQTAEETADKFLDSLENPTEGEQPQEGSPATEQSESPEESGSVPPKNAVPGETDSFEGVPKGFQNHPQWMKREQKLKEAEGRLKDLESEQALYARLLDDPDVYAKFLRNQGFSEERIKGALLEKGFEPKEEKKPVIDKQAQANDIALKACQKLGWDINRLSPEQKAYLNDHVSLTMAVLEDALKGFMDARLAPIESFIGQGKIERQLTEDQRKVKVMAKEEFPDLDWEKEIEPAMHRFLDELDKKDPQKKMPLSYEDLYHRATRDLLKERIASRGRQEVRDEAKKNSRPLTPGASVPRGKDGQFKGKNASETADKFLDSIGLKS